MRVCVCVCVCVYSKFDHTNVVKLIGVCFDTRPYYIVLELLDGGDLKTFLRQVRPRQVPYSLASPILVMMMMMMKHRFI